MGLRIPLDHTVPLGIIKYSNGHICKFHDAKVTHFRLLDWYPGGVGDGLPSVTDTLISRGLSWLGHVYRMSEGRLPKQLLYSRLLDGQRNQGRPLLRFKDITKRNMKWRNIDTRQ